MNGWVTDGLELAHGLIHALLGQDQRPPGGAEFGGSSPIGLVVILVLFVAVFFLIRSMNKHLRKVPRSFEQPQSLDPPKQEEATKPERGSDERGGTAG